MRGVVQGLMPMSEFSDIFDAFELLGDWEARYQYLSELGEQMDPMPEGEKTEANRVKACMSTVHVTAYRDERDPDIVRFRGDCDTAIIKGVLALLVEVMSGKTAQQVAGMEIDRLFSGLRLQEHLSPTRHVGIFAIVEHMKDQAQRLRRAA